MPKIKYCVKMDPQRGSWRIEILVGRKLLRTEHVFHTEATASAVAIHFVKAIRYSYGEKEAVGDNFIP